MYKQILLAYDGSQSGQKALLACQDLAQWADSELALVAVVPLHLGLVSMEGGVYDGNLMEREKLLMQGVLDDGVALLHAAGHHAIGTLLIGDTVDQITEYANTIKADLIVVGHKHLDGWAARWWKGSVSKALIAQSPCSVLVAITR